LQAGSAFGAFHRYINELFEAGKMRRNTSQVTSATAAVDSASSASRAAGEPIQDRPMPAPGG
jgi:hypothetical protein